MPTYQYACTECGHAFDQFQSFSDDSLTECPECSGKLRKLFNAVGVVFKGSGFYRNDSRATVDVSESTRRPRARPRPRPSPTTKSETKTEKKRRAQDRVEGSPPPPLPRAPVESRLTPAAARLASRDALPRISLPASRPVPYAAPCCAAGGCSPLLLTAVAVAAGLHAVAAPPPATVPVLVAARDLPAGAELRGRRPGRRRVRAGLGARRPGGRPRRSDAGGAAARGEPVTDVRLVGPRARPTACPA